MLLVPPPRAVESFLVFFSARKIHPYCSISLCSCAVGGTISGICLPYVYELSIPAFPMRPNDGSLAAFALRFHLLSICSPVAPKLRMISLDVFSVSEHHVRVCSDSCACWPSSPSFRARLTLPGGFAKIPRVPSDILHSFYSLSWLSLAGETGVQRDMDVALGITRAAAERLGRHHVRWKERAP